MRVPGNFHIAHHQWYNLVENLDVKFDNTFILNHLSFGEATDLKRIETRFPGISFTNPLDNFALEDQSVSSGYMRVGFHLDVIPSIFTDYGLGTPTTIETF